MLENNFVLHFFRTSALLIDFMNLFWLEYYVSLFVCKCFAPNLEVACLLGLSDELLISLCSCVTANYTVLVDYCSWLLLIC